MSFSKARRLVAVDETVEKRLSNKAYVWSAIDVDTGEITFLGGSLIGFWVK